MKKVEFALSTVLPIMALTAVLYFTSQPILAQSSDSSRNAATQQQPVPNDQSMANAQSEKTFNGMIVKAGDKFVLQDGANKTTYQLDDQQKAQDFLNKAVKVIGVLDASTGTIRVSAIDPA